MTWSAALYGGSLYNLAAEEKLTEVIMQQTQEICKIFRENPEYLRLLSEPSIPFVERKRLIEDAFGAQVERYLVNFLKLLCERSMLSEYAGCCEEFVRRYHLEYGIARALVTSAVELTEVQMNALKVKLEKISGKKIVLEQKTDPAVMAGICVELEGRRYDGTVQGRLDGISRKLDEIIV